MVFSVVRLFFCNRVRSFCNIRNFASERLRIFFRTRQSPFGSRQSFRRKRYHRNFLGLNRDHGCANYFCRRIHPREPKPGSKACSSPYKHTLAVSGRRHTFPLGVILGTPNLTQCPSHYRNITLGNIGVWSRNSKSLGSGHPRERAKAAPKGTYSCAYNEICSRTNR